MKYENVFIGEIYQITKCRGYYLKTSELADEFQREYFIEEGIEYIPRFEIEKEFVKYAILKKLLFDRYQDLETKIIYRSSSTKLGKMIVDEETLLPFNQALEQKETVKYITKKRVLQKYNQLIQSNE